MNKFASQIRARGLARWQIVVCLLLAALVVYNPFLGGAEFGAGLCVRHPASNRATVGASELQHFTPINSRAILSTVFFQMAEYLGGLDQVTSERRSFGAAVGLPATQYLPASLWFRPPPVV
jgi:cytosine/uracil/thiamine/allantoin permease